MVRRNETQNIRLHMNCIIVRPRLNGFRFPSSLFITFKWIAITEWIMLHLADLAKRNYLNEIIIIIRIEIITVCLTIYYTN